MKKIAFLCLILLFVITAHPEEKQSEWVGIWKITYFSINDDVWKERKIELNSDGAVNEWSNTGSFEHKGNWDVEYYPLQYSSLRVYELRINIGLEEFIIIYGAIGDHHLGIGAIAEMDFKWPTNVYEFEFIKIGNL